MNNFFTETHSTKTTSERTTVNNSDVILVLSKLSIYMFLYKIQICYPLKTRIPILEAKIPLIG